MKHVRYTEPKPNFTRTMRIQDFVSLGIPAPPADAVWSTANGFTVVMSNKVSDSLVAKLPEDFMIMKELGDDEILSNDVMVTSSDQSASVDPKKSSDDSQGDPDDDDESLTGDDDLDA